MTEYGYKVRLVNEECQHERLVPFHDDRFLEYHAAGEQALKHLSSQTCPRCGVNHTHDSYVPTDIERGEPDWAGIMQWRNAYPTRVDEWAHPELFA